MKNAAWRAAMPAPIRRRAALVARSLDQRLAVEPPHRPFILRDRRPRAIELLRGTVPVEHRPIHPHPSALDRDLRHPLEQRLSDAAAAKALGNENILEVETGTPAPGAVVAKKQREARGIAVALRDEALERRFGL